MRCDDCLDDLPSVYFVVMEFEDKDDDIGEEKHICHGCAGWYGEKATEVTE